MQATRTYTVILEPVEEGGFIVHVPALPEVIAEGDDEPHALAMAKEAIEAALEERLAQGADIPTEPPTQIRSITVRVSEPPKA